MRAGEDSSNSPLPGVTYFWQDADKPPSYFWEQWARLFEVAVLAKHSNSMTELLRNVDEQHPKEAGLMGNLEETLAKRKVVSLLYIAVGKSGREMLMDETSNINILIMQLQNMVSTALNVSKYAAIEP